MQRFFALQFHYQLAVYDKVRPEATVKLHRLINQRNRFLPFHPEATFFQFVGKTVFISRLEKAGPELAVDRQSCANHLTADINLCHSRPPPCHAAYDRRLLTAKIAKDSQRTQRGTILLRPLRILSDLCG